VDVRYVLSVLLLHCALVNASPRVDNDTEMDVDVSESTENQASSESNVVGADVEMTGYAIINGKVWIDGVEIHKPQSRYISRKNGKTYHIRWGKNDNASVTEE
jgi:hypothetical protein